jgi:glycosyltransferase involved in cell wall biosynthesis
MNSRIRNPRIAVIVPVYHARFLAAALESVFGQSHLPDEVIVINDGSPEEGLVRRALVPYARHVRLIEQTNQGAGAARNAGIHAATADLIALLDADDRWLPHFLREQVMAFADSPRLDVSYTDGLYIGDTPLAGRTFSSTCGSRPPITFERLLAQQCTVLLSAVVARRRSLIDAGAFDRELRRGQDFDLWLRVARRGGRIDYLPRVLVLRREHRDNLSGNTIDAVERPLTVLRKTLATMPLRDHERAIACGRVRELEAALARERGKVLLGNGDFDAARQAFEAACAGVHAWKLHAARLGLRLAPQLVRRLYLSRAASAAS